MSKRYGRKQKRKHREQIEALERDRRVLLEAARRDTTRALRAEDALEQIGQRLEEWDQDIGALLGEHTAFRYTPSLINERVAGFIRELAVYPDMPMEPWRGAEIAEAVTAIRMPVLRFLISLDEKDLMQLKRLMRLRITCGTEPVIDRSKKPPQAYNWAYAVSEDLFRRGLAERDIIYIAEQIAVQFHHRMKAELGRKVA